MAIFSRKSKAERIMKNADKLMSEMEDLKAQTWSSIADISKKMQEASSPEEIEELSAQLQAIAKANQSVLGMGLGVPASGQVTASGMPVREWLPREDEPSTPPHEASVPEESMAKHAEENRSQNIASEKVTPEPAVEQVETPVKEPEKATPPTDNTAHEKPASPLEAAVAQVEAEQRNETKKSSAEETVEPASKPKKNKIGLTRAPEKKKEKKPEIATNMNPYTSLSFEDQIFDYFTTSSVETYKSADQISNKVGSGATGKFTPIETEKRSAAFEEAVARVEMEQQEKAKATQAQAQTNTTSVEQASHEEQDDFLAAAAELAHMHTEVQQQEKTRLSVDQTQALSALDTGQFSIPPEEYVAAGEKTVREKALLSDEDKALASLENTDATSVTTASEWVQGEVAQTTARKASIKGMPAAIARAHNRGNTSSMPPVQPQQTQQAPEQQEAHDQNYKVATPIPQLEKEMADFKYVSSSKDGRLALYEDENGHFSIVDTSRFS
ncbi:MAG: hypothetical protein IJV62_02300 [Eggerthellaceae bacterium]|nr:hypothetical protein [Eggerthellaceae bacterium]